MKLKNNIAISESGFIFNPEMGTSFTTNKLGVAILKQLKEQVSSDDIKRSIINNYEIDEITCEKDLNDFLNQVKQYNLVEDDE